MTMYLPTEREWTLIVVTDRRGDRLSLNPDLVTRIRSIPETMLELVDGSKVIVLETVSEVHDRMADYRAYVMQLALRGEFPEHPANTNLNATKE